MRRSAALIVVALVAACSSGSEPGAGKGQKVKDPMEIVDDAQLTAADLGQGWRKVGDEAPGRGDQDRLQRCVGGALDVAEDTLAESHTRTFERAPSGGDVQQQVISSTAVLATPAAWRTFFQVVSSEQFAGCLSSVLTDELATAAGEGVTVTAGAVEHTSTNGRVRIVTPLTITVDHRPLPGRLDLLLIGRGQAVSVVVGFSVAEGLPEGLVTHLGDLLLDRQAAP